MLQIKKSFWKGLFNLTILVFTADAGGQYLYLKSYLYGLGIKGAALQMLFEYKPFEFILNPFVAGPLLLLIVFRERIYRMLISTVLTTTKALILALAILLLIPAGIGYSKGRMKENFLTTDKGKKVILYQGSSHSLLQEKRDLIQRKESYTILANSKIDSLSLTQEKIK